MTRKYLTQDTKVKRGGMRGLMLDSSSDAVWIKKRGLTPAWCVAQSDNISHIDIEDDHIDTVISHIDIPYPTSISRMTISIWWMSISIYHMPYRYPIFHIDTHIDISLISDIPYRYPISISHIDTPIMYCHSECVALPRPCVARRASPAACMTVAPGRRVRPRRS